MYDGNFVNIIECIYERSQISTNICYNDTYNKKCENIKTITPSLSNKHVFIDILHHNEGTVLICLLKNFKGFEF